MNVQVMLQRMQRPVPERVPGEYDGATRLWTTVLGVMIAGVVDWFAIVVPARFDPPHVLHMRWWWVAMAVALLSPVGWFTGRAYRRDVGGIIVWVCAVALMVVAQLVVLEWGNS